MLDSLPQENLFFDDAHMKTDTPNKYTKKNGKSCYIPIYVNNPVIFSSDISQKQNLVVEAYHLKWNQPYHFQQWNVG